jgi:hypothetical protein
MVANNTTMELKNELKLHEELRAKKKKKGIRDPVLEMKIEDSFSVSRKEWVKRSYKVDRENDTYDEVIHTDDGKIIHEDHGPLSEHQEHGDAKKKKFVDEHSSDTRKTEETDGRTNT